MTPPTPDAPGPTQDDLDEAGRIVARAHLDVKLGGTCSARPENIHCDCWWDGDACCACGDPPMTEDEMRVQGMIE